MSRTGLGTDEVVDWFAFGYFGPELRYLLDDIVREASIVTNDVVVPSISVSVVMVAGPLRRSCQVERDECVPSTHK